MKNFTKQTEIIDQYIQSMHGFSGSVLVAVQGEIMIAKGYGLANVELSVANHRNTVYRIGSITKPITAAAIMTLIQQGKLRTTDYITKYLPHLPQWNLITIHHLLTHRSGVPNLVMLPEFQELSLQAHTVDELITLFCELPLNFEPGTQFEYTNSGYLLLGKIIEIISGLPYADYVEQCILRPAGMDHTALDNSQDLVPHRASGYEYDLNGTLVQASYLHMSNAHAAGGFTSTIDDLYRMDRALRTYRWFDQAVTQMMYAPQEPPYGYGWFITSPSHVFHHGGINGFTSTFVRHLTQDFTVIALSNHVTPNTSALGQQIMAMLEE